MAKITVGAKMPDFTFETPFEKGLTLSGVAGKIEGKTAVVFLRYYGCTSCQLDIQDYAKAHAEMTANGGQLFVVLQSDPAKLAEQLTGDKALPYSIICDPDQGLYKMLEIAAAGSPEELVGDMDRLKEKGARAAAQGLSHGEYEGEELQLPAAFVMTPDLTVTYAHYAKDILDMPGTKELTELLK